MDDMDDDGPPIIVRRIEKPFGIYVMASYDLVVIGLMPLLFLLLGLRGDHEYPFIAVFLSVILCFAVMGAAVWAASGDSFGRKFLLAVVSITAAVWIIGAVTILTDGESLALAPTGVLGYLVRGVTALILNWWYFNRKNVVEYYRWEARRAKATN